MKKAVFFFLSFFFLSALPAFASCTATLNPPNIPANTTTTVNVTYTDSSYAVGSVGENASMNSVAGITTPSWSTGCTVYNSDHYGCAMNTAHQNDGSWTVPVTFNISSDQIGHFEVDPAGGGSSDFCNAILYVNSDYPTQTPKYCSVSLNPPHIPANTTTTVNVTYTDSSYAVGSVGENALINSIAGITTPSWSDGCTNYSGNHYGCAMNTAHQNDGSWTVPVDFNISSDQMGRYEVDPAGGGSSHFCYANLYIDSDYTNQPPSINALSNATINEGDTYTASGSFSDPDSTSWTATVDYGDGSGSHVLTLSGTNFSLSHVYSSSGTFPVTVKVTDNQGATGTGTATVTVNAPPHINQLNGASINEGDTYSENGSFTDPDSTSWTATVDYGDGGGAQTLSLNGTTFALNHTYTTAGTFTVTVSVTDNQGATGTGTATVTVNAPPQINSFSGGTINEGDTYTSNGSFTDTDSNSWTATVDYGDGGGAQSLTLSGTNFSLSHQYKDEGTYTVTVKVTDNQGATGTGTATVTVNNATPSVGTITVSTNPVQVNTATSATASFTDPGVLDTHTASWNWGDGNTTTGTVTESNGSGSVSDSHTYTAAGVYTVTLTVTDDDGLSATSTFQYVSVYNPTSQGLFTAGQRFSSPAGAYPQNQNLTGTVKFGLSYKYQGTMPVGVRQFTMNFNAANLTFNATSISSLVVANSMATLTGSGTINGSGNYNFLVTGVNGGGIRIQITDPSNNNNVIYDTQPGAAATATPTTSVNGNVIAHN